MAGINGFGVNGLGGSNLGETAPAQDGGGILGARARVQYAALVGLRWHMFTNGLRSIHGLLDLGATGIAWMLYSAFGLGLSAGLCAIAYTQASHESWQRLPVLLWAVSFVWLMLPVALTSFQEQFDLGILLRFPVRFGSYFLLYVIFGVMEASTILGALFCFAIWLGIVIARPELYLWTALGLAVLAAFNILLVRAVFAWIDRWLAQRKTREIVGAVFMVLVLSLQLLNPVWHQQKRIGRDAAPEQARAQVNEYRHSRAEFDARYGLWLHTANAVQQWLPPGLGARVTQQAAAQQPAAGLASAGLLGLWVLVAAGVLAGRLRSEYRGENLGSAPARVKAVPARSKSSARDEGWRLGGSGPIAAVVEKEVRSLRRTLPLLWALCVPLLFVLILPSLFHSGASRKASSFPYGLPLCVAYAQLGFVQLLYNNLGAEGAGIQLLFLSPKPIRTVILAKNLLHALLYGLVAFAAGAMSSLRLGVPALAVMAAVVAWLLFALPIKLAVGNILSLTMSYRINPGRITRQAGSQANALTAMLVELGVLAVGAAVIALCMSLRNLWLAVPIFLALAALAAFVWMRVLGNVDAMAYARRDELIARLMKDS